MMRRRPSTAPCGAGWGVAPPYQPGHANDRRPASGCVEAWPDAATATSAIGAEPWRTRRAVAPLVLRRPRAGWPPSRWASARRRPAAICAGDDEAAVVEPGHGGIATTGCGCQGADLIGARRVGRLCRSARCVRDARAGPARGAHARRPPRPLGVEIMSAMIDRGHVDGGDGARRRCDPRAGYWPPYDAVTDGGWCSSPWRRDPAAVRCATASTGASSATTLRCAMGGGLLDVSWSWTGSAARTPACASERRIESSSSSRSSSPRPSARRGGGLLAPVDAVAHDRAPGRDLDAEAARNAAPASVSR